MARVAFISLVLSAAWIGGCATDPPPTLEAIQEEADLAELALTTPWRAGGASSEIQDNWLATFDDDELDALVAEAMARNPDLRIAATRVAQAEQRVEVAKAALLPAVNLIGSGGLNMGGGDVNSALQGISLGASWEPDLWGRIRYGRNAAQSDHASMQADFEFARQSLAATIARSWFTASETWLELQAAEEIVKAAQDLVRLAETRSRIGPGSEADVALARASLGSFQETARQLQLAHGQSLRALEVMLGRYPAAELRARHDLSALPGPVPAGLPLQMLERRPDLIAAERRVAAAFNRVGEAKAARLPRFILNANVASIGSDIVQLKDDFHNPVGGIGAKLIAPIYSGGQLEAEQQIRTLQQKEAVAEYARLALRALEDVEGSLAASSTLDDRRRILEQVVADNRRSLELAQIEYRIGRADLRAVQQQQQLVHAATISLLRVRSEQLIQRVTLHLALGGSFEQPPPPPDASVATDRPAPGAAGEVE